MKDNSYYYLIRAGVKQKVTKDYKFYEEFDKWKKTSEYKSMPKFAIRSYPNKRWRDKLVDTKITIPEIEFENHFLKIYLKNKKYGQRI